jgi:hypothetical protein
MINCKFLGFRRAVVIETKAHVTMKDCLVDLTVDQPYAMTASMVSEDGCQLAHSVGAHC